MHNWDFCKEIPMTSCSGPVSGRRMCEVTENEDVWAYIVLLTCEPVLSLQEDSGDHKIHEDDTADQLPLWNIPISFLTQTPFPCSALCLECPSLRTSHGCLSYYSAQMPLSWRGSQPVCIQRWCSVAQSCPTLCGPMDCSTPVLPVLHHLQSLLRLLSMEPVKSSNPLILCCPLLLLPSTFPSIRVFSNELALHIYICIFSYTYYVL